VNAPMIVVADYSKGSEGYSYNYYVCVHLLSLFLANFYLLMGGDRLLSVGL
jgi:nicotinic acid mononucleotide adenylyltransferase